MSATVRPIPSTVVLIVSDQVPKVLTRKSYNPPIRPLTSNVPAPLPPSPLTRIWVVAVASGKGYLPCISLTKYFLKGIRNRIPSTPPSREDRNICMKLTSTPRIYIAGRVNIAPATTAPEHPPMDCMMTFCPSPSFFPRALVRPTAMMAIGMAASKTCPTRRPR